MRTTYRISAKEIGTIYLKRRKIAKALRWWLRENGILFHYSYSFTTITLFHQRSHGYSFSTPTTEPRIRIPIIIVPANPRYRKKIFTP